MNDDDFTISKTTKYQFACDGPGKPVKSMYVINNFPRIMLKQGHTGSCRGALLETIGTLLTLIFEETDLPLDRVWQSLLGISCAGGVYGRKSCMDALGQELREQERGMKDE